MEVPTEEAWQTQVTTIQISEIPNAASQNLKVPSVGTTNTTLAVPRIPDPCDLELLNAGVASMHTAPAFANLGRPEDAQRWPSVSCLLHLPHVVVVVATLDNADATTKFERATSEFVHIEEGRLHLEEMRIAREHGKEMARMRVEYQINEILQILRIILNDG